jgi:hypothetical protein
MDQVEGMRGLGGIKKTARRASDLQPFLSGIVHRKA